MSGAYFQFTHSQHGNSEIPKRVFKNLKCASDKNTLHHCYLATKINRITNIFLYLKKAE